MIKLVISSFYNTLIDSEEAIPRTTMNEIDRIRKKGILFAVATNGFNQEILDYNKDFSFVDYIISLNGSCVYDVNKERYIYKKKLTVTNIRKVIEAFSDNNIFFYSIDKKYSNYSDNYDVYKIEVEISSNEEEEKLLKTNVNSSIIKRDNKTYLEITANKASVFQSIDQLSINSNISLNNILVICGNSSEISVVKNILNNYVVKNAPKELIDIANNKTTSNDNKGVEKVIKTL